MKTEIEVIKSNDLRYSILAHDKEGNPIYIQIRLNDECKNGHQDFAITGDIYQKGKPKIDRYCIAGGCIHDDIIKACPDLKIFVNLHLCDYEGIPTYAVENGFYHLTNGFNNTHVSSPEFKNEFCEYYRISSDQFEVLKTSKNQLQYALNLQKLGILSQWKEEANEAIKILEEMTGKVFIADSIKTQFHAPTPEQLKEEAEKQENGYYTKEAEQKREEAKRDNIIKKLEADRDKEINKATEEFEVKKQVLIIGGESALKNCIFYNHTKTLTFNWRNYDKISDEAYEYILENIKLPFGVKITNDKGRN
jgi:hypothetical protein